jgi:hypothetical protein
MPKNLMQVDVQVFGGLNAQDLISQHNLAFDAA